MDTKQKRRMNNHQLGILYIIMAAFFFALMSFFVRLSGDLPTMQKAFFRNLVALAAAAAMLAKSGGGFRVKKGCGGDLFARAAFGTMGLLCNFWAIDRMQIADANLLNKLSPFFAILMSVPLSHEKPGRVEWLCVFLAFFGAVFVVKPSAGVASLPALVGVLGGFGAGAAYAFVHRLGRKGERTAIIVFVFSAFSCLACLPFILFDYHTMSVSQLLLLLCAGGAATGGQLSVTMAYKKAPAKEISVFDFSQVLWAALIGFFFLGELPDGWSLLGYGIILATAVWKWNYVRRTAKEE